MTAQVLGAVPGQAVGLARVSHFVWVACDNELCPSVGARRQVFLRRVAHGVVEKPCELLCEACGFSLAFNLWEDTMPKLHADRDPTYKTDIAPPPPASAQTRAVPAVSVPFPDELISGPAIGGLVDPSSWYLVGENGPAPLVIPEGSNVLAEPGSEIEVAGDGPVADAVKAQAKKAAKKTPPRKASGGR